MRSQGLWINAVIMGTGSSSAHITVPASKTTAICIPAHHVYGMSFQKHKLDQAADAALFSENNILQIRKLEQVTQWVSSVTF